MNSDMTWGEFCIDIIFCAIFLIVGICLGCKAIRQEAIEAGVARYEVDAKTGKTQFIFIKPQ